jgi:hypothetical protein
MGHALAHNFGIQHDPSNPHDDGTGSAWAEPVAEDAYGYRDPQNRFRDIMADDCEAPGPNAAGGYNCPRAPFYSTTETTYNGRPIGNSSRNAARVMNQFRHLIANYRDRSGGGPVPTPDPGPNLALNKTATGSAPCTASTGPEKAVNGSIRDKWCSKAAGKKLQVDLGAAYNLTSFVIKHAGVGVEPSSQNTRAFTIKTSLDGVTWTKVVKVTNNRRSTSRHTITATSARYVKLGISQPTQAGATGSAKIYELQVYGEE